MFDVGFKAGNDFSYLSNLDTKTKSIVNQYYKTNILQFLKVD